VVHNTENTASLYYSEGVFTARCITTEVTRLLGRTIAQAVSRWLPIAAARVRSQVWSSEDLVRAVVNCRVCELAIAACSYVVK
jgi:hypothetical protein